MGQNASTKDPFKEGVRTTEPLNPIEEKATFELPQGFEIELVAAEPDISKPMNMSFDSKGQLWVTDTLEYPFPVPLDQKGRDSIKVFTDTDNDGQYDKMTTFAEGLNIPIGLYPYKNGVIAWSIPNIWWIEDTDHDGVADERKKLYGPLGWERDTHGMNASFTRGFDGWLYATHGFNNNTTIRGSDGSEVVMNSGNTYRIRLDGSRVEQHTFGQVNPFGMCIDPLGNFYTADCHSAPVYQLIRGGYYPSFGKPHDGLGFAPTLMSHAHGSTAICGIVFYDDDLWPIEFRENVFIGNVMTSRLNRDMLLASGSSRKAIEMPDLLKTKDPWFRPVDLQLGPDGALYIADFYNRIIGHYEVPLKHPGRDRERGRIWKLSYKGTTGKNSSSHGLPDFTTMESADLISELGHSNITRRMLVANYLVDSSDHKTGKRIRRQWNQGEFKNWKQRVQALWILHRLNLLNENIIGDAVHDETMEVRTHAMHLLAELKKWTKAEQNWVILALQDDHPNVQRAASNALSLHPNKNQIRPLLKVRETAPKQDPQWLHGMRLALRNQLLHEDAWKTLDKASLTDLEAERIADVAVAVQSEGAGDFLAWFISSHKVKPSLKSASYRHAARFASSDNLMALARLIPRRFPNDIDLQLELFEAVRKGVLERGKGLTGSVKNWGIQLTQKIIQQHNTKDGEWSYRPVEGLRKTPNPWFLQNRSSADGDPTSPFLCSLPPGGESFTGILRSPVFNCPNSLSFFLAGHDGFPDKERQQKNKIRLVDANSNEVLFQEFAPRNDTAQPFKWNSTDLKGRAVFLEIVDSDEGAAYAWLAFGRLTPNVISLPQISPNKQSYHLEAAADLIGQLHLKQFKPNLRQWIIGPIPDSSVSVAAARSLGILEKENLPVRLADFLKNGELSKTAMTSLRQAMVSDDAESQIALLGQMVSALPLKQQQEVVNLLSNHTSSINWLMDQIENGKLSPLTLRNQNAIRKIEAVLSKDKITYLKTLIAGLADPDHALQDLIDIRTKNFESIKPDLTKGRILYDQACAMCHRMGGNGAVIGPQLDGISSRGVSRVIEDILAPNRNLDPAFQALLIKTKNGEVVSGLLRKEEENLVTLANTSGAEITIKTEDILSREILRQSLMPDNFGELFNNQQLVDLVGFLLNPDSGTN